MPVVMMKRGERCKISAITLARLVANLPTIIADALDMEDDPNARLTAKDIEVWPLPPTVLDRNAKSLAFLIFAHGYDARVKNLEERKEKIISGIKTILGKHSQDVGWVWIFTGMTAFGKI